MRDNHLQIAARMLCKAGRPETSRLNGGLAAMICEAAMLCRAAQGELISKQAIAVIIVTWRAANPTEHAYQY